MGIRILYDKKQGEACIYDSITQWAFGPVFTKEKIDGKIVTANKVADKFLTWLKVDPRSISGRCLEKLYDKWIKEIDPNMRKDRRRKKEKDELPISPALAQVALDHMQGRSYLYGCVPKPKKNKEISNKGGEMKGSLVEPKGRYLAHCWNCHSTAELCLIPHRNEDGYMIGWVFACVHCASHSYGADVVITPKKPTK